MLIMPGLWLQNYGNGNGVPSDSRFTFWLMIFVGIVAFAMLVQAIVVAITAYGAIKIRKRAMQIVEELRLKALPIIDRTHGLVHDLDPKIRTIADNFVETSHVVRSKAQDFDSTLTDVNQKARAQAARVDGMVSSVLDTAEGVGSAAKKAVKVPAREFSGIMAGLKAALDVLVGGDKRSRNHYDRKVKDYEDESIGY
jgi:methyl-accepting chemotaxis protein